jgi:hypothetical protein
VSAHFRFLCAFIVHYSIELFIRFLSTSALILLCVLYSIPRIFIDGGHYFLLLPEYSFPDKPHEEKYGTNSYELKQIITHYLSLHPSHFYFRIKQKQSRSNFRKLFSTVEYSADWHIFYRNIIIITTIIIIIIIIIIKDIHNSEIKR